MSHRANEPLSLRLAEISRPVHTCASASNVNVGKSGQRPTSVQDADIIGVVQDDLPPPVLDVRQPAANELVDIRISAMPSSDLHALCDLTYPLLEAGGAPSMDPQHPCVGMRFSSAINVCSSPMSYIHHLLPNPAQSYQGNTRGLGGELLVEPLQEIAPLDEVRISTEGNIRAGKRCSLDSI
ncbi:hypothetical protein LTR81_026774 [Elasticomyces elasticus]